MVTDIRQFASGAQDAFIDVGELLRERRPVQPVYCIYPKRYRASARHFVGAYSLSGRTDFNGHYSENIVTIHAD